MREPTPEEIAELIAFVKVYQPDAVLRDREGLNVRVGNYFPPKGGQALKSDLISLLVDAEHWRSPYDTHCLYEQLHPFTDGNGRSGRALWAWQMKLKRKHGSCPLGFLHHFYYQSLAAFRAPPDE